MTVRNILYEWMYKKSFTDEGTKNPSPTKVKIIHQQSYKQKEKTLPYQVTKNFYTMKMQA